MKKWIYSGTREEQPSERELMHGKLARKAASEGIVLLKNEGILPLKKDTAAALLGYGAEKTVKGGIGSGDVNNRKNISIYQGLKEAGVKNCKLKTGSAIITIAMSRRERRGKKKFWKKLRK